MSILSVKNLSYRVGEKEILHDISFDVEEGSMTCIVGPNGCGKSTLLSHISRKLPSKMNIYYKGKPTPITSSSATTLPATVTTTTSRKRLKR